MNELPKPEPGETVQQFVARCHADAAMLRKYPKGHDRRHAAQDAWRLAQPLDPAELEVMVSTGIRELKGLLKEEVEVLDTTEDPQSEVSDLPKGQPQDGPGSPADGQPDP